VSAEQAKRREIGILDTSAVIHLAGLSPEQLPLKPLITTVTLAELSVGPLTAESETAAIERQSHLQMAEADFEPLPFDVAAARSFGHVSPSLRRAGRKAKARTFDAMIAAIALAGNLPVYTCNPGDFSGIDGLEVVAVPVPR
jgi:predicted nucleic acid-binding protein